MDNGLSLSLKQQLRVTTQLMQTMEIMSLSSAELAEKIRKEAETNPVLTLVDNSSQSLTPFSDSYIDRTDKRESYSDSEPYSSSDDREATNWVEGMVSQGESLCDHLLSQLELSDQDEIIKEAATMIITSLDKNGFTGENPARLLDAQHAPYLEPALSLVQSLDPIGVGATDYKEALALQAQSVGCKGEELSLLKKLIYDELENVRTGRLDQIARNLGTEREDVEQLILLLKCFTPYPGLKYNNDYETYIEPELSIKKREGKLVLTMNRAAIPTIEIDSSYVAMLSELKEDRSSKAKDALKYLKDKVRSAENLSQLVSYRASSLEKVGRVLLSKQAEFFLNGPKYLKGMTMAEVAEEVGVHETTISRMANSKYIDTDFGIFPIRYLFSTQMRTDSGEDTSKNAIKEMIRELIENNSSGKVLSDQKISELLAERGIKIARRTVSKYRNELRIDSSFSRVQ